MTPLRSLSSRVLVAVVLAVATSAAVVPALDAPQPAPANVTAVGCIQLNWPPSRRAIEMAQDIKTGAVMGLLIATVYSLYALVLLAARGTAPFDANGVTPAGVIAAYYGGGLVAGSVVGILRPLLRWRLGATIVGIVAAFGVFAGIGIAKEGYLWHWTIRTWQTGVISSVILGGICSNIIWRSSRSARN